MRFASRIIGVFISFLFILVFISSSYAQTPTPTNYQPQILVPNTNSNVPKNFHNYTQSVFLELVSSVICQLSGIDVVNPNQACLGIDSKSNKIGFIKNNGGAIGLLSYGINAMYTPPLHAGDYFQYLSNNFGIAKATYAQGTGFSILNPLIPIWSVFRNISYLFFIVIFIIIGVAIMLRLKIDPRTVMTIQNQIPKIIIALILITLSYAISGFLIDLMYVSIYFIYGVFSTIPGANISALSPAAIQGQNVLNAAVSLGVFNFAHQVALSGKDTINNILGVSPTSAFNVFGDLGNLFNSLFSIGGITNGWQGIQIFDILYNLIGTFTALKIASEIPCAGSSVPFLGGITCALQTGGEFALIFSPIEFFLRELLPYLIIFLIVLIAVLFTLFRVFFMLLKAYVFILIDVIFAPLWIATGLIPGGGQSKGFSSWIKDLFANIAVFPTVYTMFILANVLSNAFQNSNVTFSAPLLGNPLAPGFLSAIVGLGILLLTPDAAKMIRNAIKAPNPTGGLGGLSVGAAVVGAPVNQVRGSLFGVNQRTGQARVGSAWLGRKFGGVGQVLSGGGLDGLGKDPETGKRNIPLLRVPLPKIVSSAAQKVSEPIRKSAASAGEATSRVQQPIRDAQTNAIKSARERIGSIFRGGGGQQSRPQTSSQPTTQTQQTEDLEKVHRDVSSIDAATKRLEELAKEQKEKNNT